MSELSGNTPDKKPIKKVPVRRAMGFLLSPDELKKQVEQYSTLPFYKTVRGAVVIIFGFVILVTLLASIFIPDRAGIPNFWEAILSALIWIGWAYLIYRGKEWANIAALVFVTLDKFLVIARTPQSLVNLVIFWWIVAAPLCNSFQVEHARRGHSDRTAMRKMLVSAFLFVLVEETVGLILAFVIPFGKLGGLPFDLVASFITDIVALAIALYFFRRQLTQAAAENFGIATATAKLLLILLWAHQKGFEDVGLIQFVLVPVLGYAVPVLFQKRMGPRISESNIKTEGIAP